MEIQKIICALHKGRNIFLNGPAGTGKTTAIRELKSVFDCGCEWNYQILAPTGTAACNIQGMTIQSYFQIPPVVAQNKGARIAMQVNNSRYERDELNLLIIDEISMVGDELFEIMDRILRKKYQNAQPFGGIQCIISGDFYQLPPVKQKWCFNTKIWKEMRFVMIDFSDQKRYSCPRTFETLNRIRVGKLTPRDKTWLAARHKAYNREEYKDLPIQPIQLYANREQVDQINAENMEKIDQPIVNFSAIDEVTSRRSNFNAENMLDDLADAVCSLKVTIPVMFYRNYDIGLGLTNGRTGEVIAIDQENQTVIVRLSDGSQHEVKPKKFIMIGQGWTIARTQIPLRPGWAMTHAKSQGSTIEHAIVDLTCYNPGQAYTVLSRVTSIDNIFIKKMHPKAIKVDKEVQEFSDSYF